MMKYTGCEEVGLSDHCMIYGTMIAKEMIIHQTKGIRALWRCDIDKLVANLDNARWSVMDCFDDIEDKWECWKKLCVEILESHTPLKNIRVKRQGSPWITPKIRTLMKEKNHWCKVAKKTKLPDGWNYYTNL